MSIDSISSIASSYPVAPKATSAPPSLISVPTSAAFQAPAQTPPAVDAGVQAFMDFMKESPAEQMEDIWLAEHHLTRKDLAAMSPEKRQAILKEMADDIKRAIEDKVQAGLASTVNVLV